MPLPTPLNPRMLPLQIDLPEEERDRILDRAARGVTERRLEVPAILALELHRPLAFLGSQALIVFTPLLAPAIGLENLQKVTRLLEDRDNIERLIERIEERVELRDRRPPAAAPGAGEENAAAQGLQA